MFDIVTFCSESYKDSLNFSLPSWEKESGCDRIVIYTDGKINYDGVELRGEFEPSDDWHVWALRKPTVVKWYLDSVPEGRKFCLMDLDCLAVNGLWNEAFQDGWLGVIRWDKSVEDASPKKAAAVFFGKKCKEMDLFIDTWVHLTNQFNKELSHLKGSQGTEQIAYQFCLKALSKGIYSLNENIWSSERDSLEEWKFFVHKYRNKVKILHFKGGRWKDKNLVNEIKGII